MYSDKINYNYKNIMLNIIYNIIIYMEYHVLSRLYSTEETTHTTTHYRLILSQVTAVLNHN